MSNIKIGPNTIPLEALQKNIQNMYVFAPMLLTIIASLMWWLLCTDVVKNHHMQF